MAVAKWQPGRVARQRRQRMPSGARVTSCRVNLSPCRIVPEERAWKAEEHRRGGAVPDVSCVRGPPGPPRVPMSAGRYLSDREPAGASDGRPPHQHSIARRRVRVKYRFTHEQLALRDRTIEFARAHLGHALQARDMAGEFRRADWTHCGAHGILGAHVATEYGGQGRSAVDTVVMLEALGYGCHDNGLTLGVGGHIWNVLEPLVRSGTDEQKARLLPRLCTGEWIAVNGVSEDESGSDAFSLKTIARKVDGGYRLTGRKVFVGMAPVADLALVLANSAPDAGRWGVSAFFVERGAPGFTQSAPRPKAGTRTNPIGDLLFDDCFVPEANRLGGEGAGVSLFSRAVNWERAFILAGHVGAMHALLERTVAHARDRQQFGQSIGKFQSVSNRIANMRLRLETSRLLMYQAAEMKDRGMEATLECSMAKLHIAESLLESATDAARIHGARGYLTEFDVEREVRDMLGGVIYGGTSDIQRNIIASQLGM
jgi:alkylation response protein AidB-like acyl-CoA dehydrogenase